MSKTIAWIEDDVDIIGPVVRPLERAGYKVIRLRTAKEVFDNIQKLHDADLILLDMLLPDGGVDIELSRYTGLDIFRELLENHDLQTPVIALTVVAREEVRKNLRLLGVADIIRKPVRPSELKERIDQVLEMEPFPLDMPELLSNRTRDRVFPAPRQGRDQRSSADDPEHVKTAQGVDRSEASTRTNDRIVVSRYHRIMGLPVAGAVGIF